MPLETEEPFLLQTENIIFDIQCPIYDFQEMILCHTTLNNHVLLNIQCIFKCQAAYDGTKTFLKE